MLRTKSHGDIEQKGTVSLVIGKSKAHEQRESSKEARVKMINNRFMCCIRGLWLCYFSNDVQEYHGRVIDCVMRVIDCSDYHNTQLSLQQQLHVL